MVRLPYSTKESQRLPDPYTGIELLPENSLDRAMNTFEPISLQEMDSVALLNRMDTKFVLSTAQLLTTLQNIRQDYRILTINHQKVHHYQTLYFDTEDFALYHGHVTERAQVYKVRSREYLDTKLSYLEVKHKNQKKRTEKSRLPIPCDSKELDQQMQMFLRQWLPFSGQNLEPKLWNTFRRITLVSKSDLERLTIDLDLCFFNEHQVLHLDGIAIAEVKQDQLSRGSAFVTEMRRQGIRQTGFSKYCFGVSQLYSTVKKNSQKQKALRIEKLQQGDRHHVYAA